MAFTQNSGNRQCSVAGAFVSGMFRTNSGPLVEVAIARLRNGNTADETTYLRRIGHYAGLSRIIEVSEIFGPDRQNRLVDALLERYTAEDHSVEYLAALSAIGRYGITDIGCNGEATEIMKQIRRLEIAHCARELLKQFEAGYAVETLRQIIRDAQRYDEQRAE